jgi:hypothetical protein
MMVYSKQSYDNQDDERILKAVQKQHYIMFPVPFTFSMMSSKQNRDEEDDDAIFSSLKVSMDHEDKDSKACVVEIKESDTGTLEEFLRWRLNLNEQMKNHGDSGIYKMVMNFPNQCWQDAAFGTQSGRRDNFERQRKYMIRDIFLRNLNPDKLSEILRDMNKYLYYIPIERTTVADKTKKAYGNSLPDAEIRSIM